MNPTEDARYAFYKLANRYLTGEASSQERQQMVEQLKNSELKALFEEMRASWELELREPCPYDTEAAVERLAAITGHRQQPATRRASFLNRCRRGWRPALLVACLVVSVGVLVVGLQKTPGRAVADSGAWVERTTDGTERLAITLRDGTRITLNANGSLVYPNDFGPYARVVKLSGEAFFDVARDTARPFVVETDSLRIRVLGTRFNVRALGNRPEMDQYL
ncbi:MAG: FecR family protein [Opitutaceae bacterium]|jgi:ferric-dicitrate binding protein FerR (iron transport regulator)|nr:FecR family protein [Opitutaceae bacterium]